MKRKITFIFLLLFAFNACRKNEQNVEQRLQVAGRVVTLTIAQVKQWYGNETGGPSADTSRRQLLAALNKIKGNADLSRAECVYRPHDNWWVVHLPGQVTVDGVRQGYRKLVFYRDSTSQIRVHLLEIVPDALYIQRHLKATTEDFTGRVFIYNEQYRLQQGLVYAAGRVIGKIVPGKQTNQTQSLTTNTVTIVQDCEWHDANYVNGEGPVIYSELICSTDVYDDGAGVIGSGNGGGPATGGDYLGGGGGGGGGASSAPNGSNLPNEDDPKINPKKYMDCFGTIPDAGAKTTVTVYVQEPWPGTSFNVGPNSVGHTAIGLTKTNGNTTITQVVGFYPDATGFAKIHSPSKILDNGGDLQYTVSVTFSVLPSEFNKIVNYISRPPVTYDLVDFNCTNFVYNACLMGGITLPDPTTTVGLSGPGGATTAMTPAGLGNKLDNSKNQNINHRSAITPFSKGSCD